uniref:Thioredoxin like 4A n=2 Tax=Equus asinus TaxID=9793 RepID=A0A9L0JM67_EQUAS
RLGGRRRQRKSRRECACVWRPGRGWLRWWRRHRAVRQSEVHPTSEHSGSPWAAVGSSVCEACAAGKIAGAVALRMSYMLPHLHNGWQVDQAILSEEDRVVVIRFGHDWDPTCMKMDEVLYSIAEKKWQIMGDLPHLVTSPVWIFPLF